MRRHEGKKKKVIILRAHSTRERLTERTQHDLTYVGIALFS